MAEAAVNASSATIEGLLETIVSLATNRTSLVLGFEKDLERLS